MGDISYIDGNDGNDRLYALGDKLYKDQSVTLKGGRGNDFLTADLDPTDKHTIYLYGGDGCDTFILAESLANKEQEIAEKIFLKSLEMGFDLALSFAGLPKFGELGAYISTIGNAINGVVKSSLEIGSLPSYVSSNNKDDLVQIMDFTLGDDMIVLPGLIGDEVYSIHTINTTNSEEFFIQVKRANETNFTNIANVKLSDKSRQSFQYLGLRNNHLQDAIGKTFSSGTLPDTPKDYTIGDLAITNGRKSANALTETTSDISDVMFGGSGNDQF
jgi:hypothetical protein